MKLQVVPSSYEYQKQLVDLRTALEALSRDDSLPIAGNGLTGNSLYVAERNEWWFEVWTRWSIDGSTSRTTGWCRIFPDQREFDRQYGSPDPESSYGFRQAETVADALAGRTE